MREGNLYDVIIIDLPDPKGPNLARLYATDFYRDCERHLSVGGVLVTQASSPLHARKAFLCILKTVESAGFSAVPYQNAIPSMGTWGWVLAKKRSVISRRELALQLEGLTFRNLDTDFLNQEAMAGMLKFWKGAFDGLESIAVSTMMEPVIDRYYKESEWGF